MNRTENVIRALKNVNRNPLFNGSVSKLFNCKPQSLFSWLIKSNRLGFGSELKSLFIKRSDIAESFLFIESLNTKKATT